MWSPTLVLLAVVSFTACASIGGGVYPAHCAFEAAIAVALVLTWSDSNVRTALLIALASHVVMRVWSFVDAIPKAAASEKADPARVDRAAAGRWSRRSLLRLPLDAIASAAVFTALVAAA